MDPLQIRSGSEEIVQSAYVSGTACRNGEMARFTYLNRPCRPNKRQEVREVRYGQAKIRFGADLPFILEIKSILADDGEARTVGDIETCECQYRETRQITVLLHR